MADKITATHDAIAAGVHGGSVLAIPDMRPDGRRRMQPQRVWGRKRWVGGTYSVDGVRVNHLMIALSFVIAEEEIHELARVLRGHPRRVATSPMCSLLRSLLWNI
jgi:hypothetical protein